jgi:uncharacterized protein
MKAILTTFLLLFSTLLFAQSSYEDSINTYLKNYVQNHEVVKGKDKDHIQFYPVDKAYRVVASFKPSASVSWLSFKTSGTRNKLFKLYGTLSFTINHQPVQLHVYQSQELATNEQYKNYLFLPFTDATSGEETYMSGRYIDLTTADIRNNKVILDFNKAYNPYCAYVSGVYNCPIPPKENALPVAIKAGEKTFTAAH